MSAGPRASVQAPPAAAPFFGLLKSFPAQNDDTARWGTGIAYSPECETGQSFGICAPDDRDEVSGPGIVEWDPFVITVSSTCSTFAGFEENAGRARRLLAKDQERQLGAELWDGAIAQSEAPDNPNTWLSNQADPNFIDITGGTPLAYAEALGCLEQYLASNNSGMQGVIHASAQVITFWESFRLLRRENNRVLTFQDTIIVASPGYPSDDDGEVWAYATDVPRIFLGPVQAFEDKSSINRANNEVTLVAQRLAMVEWPRCRHAGLQLDIDPCSVGS